MDECQGWDFLSIDCGRALLAPVVDITSFTTDPLGYVQTKLQEANAALTGTVIPGLMQALAPKLDADWWIRCYAVSFALSILVLGVLVLVASWRARRGGMAGADAVRSIFQYAPLFVISAMFGPVVAKTLSDLAVELSSAIIGWGLNQTTTGFYTTFADRIASEDVVGMAGGAFVSIVILFVLALALLGVGILLLMQLGSVYLVGALLPLGLVWTVSRKTRRFGRRAPLVFLGIIGSGPLLSLMLTFAFMAINGLGFSWAEEESDPLVIFVNLATTAIIMALVVFGLPALLSMARTAVPAGESGSTDKSPFASPQGGRSHVERVSANRSSPTSRRQAPGSHGSVDSASAPDSDGALSRVLNKPSSSSTGGSVSAPRATATTRATPSPAGASGGAPATGGAGGSAAAGSTAAGTSTAGASTAGAATAGTAGAAASATGVGAAVGIPLMVGAAAMVAAKTAAAVGKRAVELSAEGAEQAGSVHEYGRDIF